MRAAQVSAQPAAQPAQPAAPACPSPAVPHPGVPWPRLQPNVKFVQDGYEDKHFRAYVQSWRDCRSVFADDNMSKDYGGVEANIVGRLLALRL